MSDPTNATLTNQTTTGKKAKAKDPSDRGPARQQLVDLVRPPFEIRLDEMFQRQIEAADLARRVVASCAAVESPVGPMVVCWTSLGVSWVRERVAGVPLAELARAGGHPVEVADAVPDWLEEAIEEPGRHEVPVDLGGVSPFQREVLDAAARIPSGQTRPYGWVAQEIGRPAAVRAVGTALGHNPVPLLVPCHRVVRSDGTAGQYIFGSAAKQRLLGLEAAQTS